MDGPWGSDAVAETPLPEATRAALLAFEGKAILVRRPRRSRRGAGVTIVEAEVTEAGGEARALVLPSLEDLPRAGLERGAALPGPLLLVCVHGRRDPCCARLGIPLYESLAAAGPPESVWQCSHLGGHRFAPNVLVLPTGVQLGRVPAMRARQVVSLLAAGRIPLDLYRGRTLHAPHVQAAEIALRTAAGLDGLRQVRLLRDEGQQVVFASSLGERTVHVSRHDGPPGPPSCGAEPEATTAWTARVAPA